MFIKNLMMLMIYDDDDNGPYQYKFTILDLPHTVSQYFSCLLCHRKNFNTPCIQSILWGYVVIVILFDHLPVCPSFHPYDILPKIKVFIRGFQRFFSQIKGFKGFEEN